VVGFWGKRERMIGGLGPTRERERGREGPTGGPWQLFGLWLNGPAKRVHGSGPLRNKNFGISVTFSKQHRIKD
jgi:hypothetical protein